MSDGHVLSDGTSIEIEFAVVAILKFGDNEVVARVDRPEAADIRVLGASERSLDTFEAVHGELLSWKRGGEPLELEGAVTDADLDFQGFVEAWAIAQHAWVSRD